MDKKVAYEFAEKYAKMIESDEQKKQNTLDLYMEMAKFKPSQFPQDKHKISYFDMNYKRILWKFFTEAGQEYLSFDDFLIDFSTWSQSITFPLSRESIAAPQKQKIIPPKQIPKQQIKVNEKQKQKIQIQPQVQIQISQQQKRPQPQIQSNIQTINAQGRTGQVTSQKQQQIHKLRMQKQERQRIIQQKAQQKQRANQQAYEQKRRQGPKASNSGNSGNQFPSNTGNQGNSRGASKSPMQGRFQDTPIVQNQELKKEDLVKKIITRIGECYQSYQKRSKFHNEIKIQIENLKRLEQIEKGERYPKMERERR